ncbi:MAG: hypothetical protein HPY74_06145 [Firmicutes bacterium]|nr:hypothetical protein [Bacillota bacterium]
MNKKMTSNNEQVKEKEAAMINSKAFNKRCVVVKDDCTNFAEVDIGIMTESTNAVYSKSANVNTFLVYGGAPEDVKSTIAALRNEKAKRQCLQYQCPVQEEFCEVLDGRT